jgi:hypothetical protein
MMREKWTGANHTLKSALIWIAVMNVYREGLEVNSFLRERIRLEAGAEKTGDLL